MMTYRWADVFFGALHRGVSIARTLLTGTGYYFAAFRVEAGSMYGSEVGAWEGVDDYTERT